MSAKKICGVCLLFAVLLGVAGLLLAARPAQAALTVLEQEPPACLSCHENLYYNYDTGKHYCLTEAATRCVDCHAGDPQALDEETAHAGLVVHPILNGDISRCQSCHVQDAQQHVDVFAALAGYSETVHIAGQAAPALPSEPAEEAARPVLDAKALVGMSVLLGVVTFLLVLCFLTNKACRLWA